MVILQHVHDDFDTKDICIRDTPDLGNFSNYTFDISDRHFLKTEIILTQIVPSFSKPSAVLNVTTIKHSLKQVFCVAESHEPFRVSKESSTTL